MSPTTSFRLGYLSYLNQHGEPEFVYARALDLVVAAESLGYDSFWVASRHFGEALFGLPDPLPFLAAAAARTTRIRLGAAVLPAAFEHPLRVAESASVVDTIARGRLELGLGSGGARAALEAYGVPEDERDARTNRLQESLVSSLDGGAVHPSGLLVQPQRPSLARRVWRGTTQHAVARRTAELDHGLLLARQAHGGPRPLAKHQRLLVDGYLDHLPSRSVPRIAAQRALFPARSHAEALRLLEPGTKRLVFEGGHYGEYRSLEQALEYGHVGYGSAQQVVDWLSTEFSWYLPSDLIVQTVPAHLEHQQEIEVLERLAVEVAPALRWRAHAALSIPSQPVADVAVTAASIEGAFHA